MPIEELPIEAVEIPNVIDQKCRMLMESLGLVFGCFDFIVTPDGEYYFLEVNESGQFLWIEKLRPEIKMLDIFTEFLINKNPKFNWVCKPDSLSLSYFEKKVSIAPHKREDVSA